MEPQEKRKTRDVCIGLEIGKPLNFQLDGGGSAKTSLVGIDAPRCLIIKPPVQSGLETKLFKKNQTVISYLHEGMVYGFRCTLIGVVKTPVPLFILSYPEASDTLNLRRHKRVGCLLAGRIRIGVSGRKAVVTDISPSGCRLTLPEAAPQADPLVVGADAVVAIEMEPINETVFLCGVVRNILAGDEGQHLGIEFHKATHQQDLQALDKVKRYIAAVHEKILF